MEELVSLREKINHAKKVIGEERDKLRDLLVEFGEIVEDADSATASLEVACRNLDDSIQTISQRM